MTPFYAHLTGVPGFGAAANIDKIGLYATAAVGGALTAHGLVQLGRRKLAAKPEAAAKPAEDEKKEVTP
jgi:hypothetical protein